MKKYKLAVFDFDGTICDTGIGIVNAVRYALEKYGITNVDEEILKRFVGPPLSKAFKENFGFSDSDATEAMNIYREYYRPKGVYESVLYEGIAHTIERLNKAGITCAIASGKPTEMINILLEKFELTQSFRYVEGAVTGHEPKDEIIEKLFAQNGLSKEDAVMIGDRDNDAEGARKTGLDFIACAYGYAEEGEFDPFPKVFTAQTPTDIADFLI